MVLGYHYISGSAQYWGAEPGGAPVFPGIHLLASYGWLGVNLFFLISGFVICMSSWGRSLGQFFVSRSARLYPAFWFGVIFTCAILTVLPTDHHRPPVAQILANLTMFPGPLGAAYVDGVYWTLWYEVLFYLSFAIVVWRGVNYRRVLLFCTLWTVASVLATAVNVPWLSGIVDQEYSMYFIAGVALYLMRRFGSNLLLWGILGFSLLLALNSFGTRLNAIHGLTGEPQNWYAGAAFIVVFFAAMLAVALGWLDRINWRWLVPAGALTYPLYLLHGVAGEAFIKYLSPRASKYLVLVAVTVAMLVIAWLCHRLVERPVSRILRRGLTSGLRAADQPAEAPKERQPSDIGTLAPVVVEERRFEPVAVSEPTGSTGN
jgi:peptidoglycan/LPS O-acetylase OafA/YrhL